MAGKRRGADSGGRIYPLGSRSVVVTGWEEGPGDVVSVAEPKTDDLEFFRRADGAYQSVCGRVAFRLVRPEVRGG